MKKGKVGFENKGLVILLGVLGVVIVGLVVGIVVMNVQGGGEIVADSFTVTDEPVDADYVLDLSRAADDTESVEEGIALYEDVIAANFGDTNNLLNLRISYSSFLLHNNLIESGLEQLDLVNKDELDIMQKIELYIAYRNYYIYIEDEDSAVAYNAEIEELMKKNNISENAEF